MKDTEASMTAIGCLDLAAGILLLFPVTVALEVGDAWVAQCLWRWFVTPAFGLPVPPLLLLTGVLLFVCFVTLNAADRSVLARPSNLKSGELTASIFRSSGRRLAVAAISLLGGFLVHLCAGWWS